MVEQTAISPSYRIVDEQGRTVWRGKACAHTTSPFSGKKRATVDFSSLTKPGNYTLIAGKYRQPIRIAEHPIDEVYEAALHAFYLQRCQHPDTCVLIHSPLCRRTAPQSRRHHCFAGGMVRCGRLQQVHRQQCFLARYPLRCLRGSGEAREGDCTGKKVPQ